MPKIIAFYGYIGTGKTTAALQVEDLGAVRLPFAQPLKDMLKALGLSEDQLNGTRKELPSELLCNRTPRFAMQTLGTEWRDMIGQDLWVNIWEHRARRQEKIVNDDLRFPHEVARIRHFRSLIVKVARKGFGPGSHASESSLEGLIPDAVLVNDGSRQDLLDKVTSLVRDFWSIP